MVEIHCIGKYNGMTGKIKAYCPPMGGSVPCYIVDVIGIKTELFAEEHLVRWGGWGDKPEESNPIKDSGERTAFDSGAVRDMHEGKGDMLSMPWAALLRVSRHYENGAKKYGRYNYLKGIPVSSFIDSALRHLAKYVAGYDDEDHLSAAAFNILGAIQMEEHCPDMCDLPWRDGKRQFHYEEAQRRDCREGENKTEERTPNLFDGD